jgi:CDP-diacylglycerol--glycerol-3-phosphate 3-phosphatidyltransferase
MSNGNTIQPAIAWRQLPNALSIARIAAAPVLVGLALVGAETAYTWLLLPALASDIVDGFIARWFHLQTTLGAKLDSSADLLITIATLIGAWLFHPELYRDYWPALVVFLGAGLLEYLLALLRYGRLSSFHTWSSKVAGVMLVAFVSVLFLDGLVPWLFYLAIGLAVLSSLEEYALLALLPTWRSNVHGVWQVWRERRG